MSAFSLETSSAEQTIAAGKGIAAKLRPGNLYILRGELGAGKTTLVKGIAQALDAADPDEVTSPTFTLIHEYKGQWAGHGGSSSRKSQARAIRLYHLDLFRVETERQLRSLGVEELTAEDAIVLVEWGEKFDSMIRLSDGEIVVENEGGDRRRISVRLSYSE